MPGKRDQKKGSVRSRKVSARKNGKYAKPKLVSRGKLSELVVRAQCATYSESAP